MRRVDRSFIVSLLPFAVASAILLLTVAATFRDGGDDSSAPVPLVVVTAGLGTLTLLLGRARRRRT